MTSRLDGPLKVTGRAKYGADHNLPGMAHGYIVVSTIAHGEIQAMDVTAAKSAPGVIGFLLPGFTEQKTHEDFTRCQTCNGYGTVLTGSSHAGDETVIQVASRSLRDHQDPVVVDEAGRSLVP